MNKLETQLGDNNSDLLWFSLKWERLVSLISCIFVGVFASQAHVFLNWFWPQIDMNREVSIIVQFKAWKHSCMQHQSKKQNVVRMPQTSHMPSSSHQSFPDFHQQKLTSLSCSKFDWNYMVCDFCVHMTTGSSSGLYSIPFLSTQHKLFINLPLTNIWVVSSWMMSWKGVLGVVLYAYLPWTHANTALGSLFGVGSLSELCVSSIN